MLIMRSMRREMILRMKQNQIDLMIETNFDELELQYNIWDVLEKEKIIESFVLNEDPDVSLDIPLIGPVSI